MLMLIKTDGPKQKVENTRWSCHSNELAQRHLALKLTWNGQWIKQYYCNVIILEPGQCWSRKSKHLQKVQWMGAPPVSFTHTKKSFTEHNFLDSKISFSYPPGNHTFCLLSYSTQSAQLLELTEDILVLECN